MTPLLSGKPISPELQEQNNRRHRPGVVIATLLVLLVYIYLFTHLSNALHLPRPQDLLEQFGIHLPHVFGADHDVDSVLWVTMTHIYNNNDELLILFTVVGAAFLSAYFLPVRYKPPVLLFWTLVAVTVLYGPRPTAGLLAAHWLVYLMLHPPSGRLRYVYGTLPGALAYLAVDGFRAHAIPGVVWWSLISVLLYIGVFLPLLKRPRAASVLQTIVVQSAMITVCLGALIEGFHGHTWALPIGLLLFFWHWERLYLYHIDYMGKRVPKTVSPVTYLSVFLTPGMIANWNWGVTLGQGYTYTVNNLLSHEKNKLVIGGLKLWGVALIYLVFGDLARDLAARGVEYYFGIPAYQGYAREMVCHYMRGGPVSTASVLITSMLDLFRWLFVWGGVVHFKAGVWRVCGYYMDPYFDKPWLATNLVTFWTRFTFHYREFLVRAFYYPVFFRFFKRHPALRIITATMASVAVGNLIWGHLSEAMFYSGVRFTNFAPLFKTWPYFFLLGAGVSVTELYLMRKKTHRKPWTWDIRIAADVLAAYLTLQFFALIELFTKTCSTGTVWDHFTLFLRAFHIDLPR